MKGSLRRSEAKCPRSGKSRRETWPSLFHVARIYLSLSPTDLQGLTQDGHVLWLLLHSLSTDVQDLADARQLPQKLERLFKEALTLLAKRLHEDESQREQGGDGPRSHYDGGYF